MTTIIIIITLCLALPAGCVALMAHRRKIYIWLPAYLSRKAKMPEIASPNQPVHILFCLVDHYEPGWDKAAADLQTARVDGWLNKYPEMADNYTDADGCHPKHTWFYPPHYYKDEHIKKLVRLCREGYGEIEMHLHHSRMAPFPDTSATLKDKITACIDQYSKYGIFKTTVNHRPATTYAFIHGDWALDNSRAEYCGVNDELTILKETGCYADFTFPAYMVEAQPHMINSIYYAKDDPDAPKSYDTGRPVQAGRPSDDDALMMVQGPIGFRWKGRRNRWFPSVDDGELAANNPPTPERVDFWIDTGVHVLGRPNWIMIKAFTHGAPLREHDVLLGEPIRQMHRYLTERYNDGRRYCLHYVTAREVYNIIRAAEDDFDGDPGQFRNYIIGPYAYGADTQV